MAHVILRVINVPSSTVGLHELSVSVRTEPTAQLTNPVQTSSDWPQHILHSCITCPGCRPLTASDQLWVKNSLRMEVFSPGPGGIGLGVNEPKVPTVSVWTPPVTQEFYLPPSESSEIHS